jgi:hypothetical protein
MIEFRCGGASMRRKITLAGQESGDVGYSALQN